MYVLVTPALPGLCQKDAILVQVKSVIHFNPFQMSFRCSALLFISDLSLFGEGTSEIFST